MPGNSRFAVSLHILAYLVYRAGAAVPSAEIARSVDTNPVVIRRLLSALAKAGLVTAHKGATGGFAIAAAPEAITLLDVYRAVEPAPDQGLRHFSPNPGCPVGARMERILHRVLGEAQAGMEAALRRVTLADMHAEIGAGITSAALRRAHAS
ncbi:RrF2 family transcriptional regulator [Opitutus terrae]|uniref:Transcriptional regulator, BadM/Rrf2 family n=1 Tax=Opitutus terrae (strain DSM 11246 / JCM 15787 / PB90-1) TaxID=452637 RepID=B1ZTT4_OPITP|nr:Rrf2 family transcriptional regulator [Opitutus terrae]ACB74870.1 transcriptional regulator, BadM/Rrf2 family [Opitutus terrae PB90-1]